jgi:hypothetical protein
MYSPSLYEQLANTRIDDIRRATHRQHTSLVSAGTQVSRDSRQKLRLRFPAMRRHALACSARGHR